MASPYTQISFVNRKPIPYGKGTLRQSPEEIEVSYEGVPDDPTDPGVLHVGAFEMQRQAARDYKKNRAVQEKGKEKLEATQTFRQRVPPYAGPRARGYRQQEVLWTDKTYKQARDLGRPGDAGYDAGGGLTLYRTAPTEANPEGTVKQVRTAKVQAVPKGSKETHEMPEHLRVLSGRTLYDRS